MFRGAVRGDLPQILKIYAHARAVMKASGNPTQWGDNFPPQELLEEDIDSNRLFLYVVNGQIEAVFAFILGADPTYAAIEDGQWLDDTLPYGTVHVWHRPESTRAWARPCWTGAWSTARACVPTPTPTTRSCSICWKRTALPAAASSMWQTARPALPTRSFPQLSRWKHKNTKTSGAVALDFIFAQQPLLFFLKSEYVLATNTDQRKTPMGTDLNANL